MSLPEEKKLPPESNYRFRSQTIEPNLLVAPGANQSMHHHKTGSSTPQFGSSMASISAFFNYAFPAIPDVELDCFY
jgi:hypothetical protein